MLDRYADILIHIRERDEKTGVYSVEATLDNGSFFKDGELRVDQQKLRATQLDAESYGMELFDAIFAGKIRRAYDKATGRAETLVAPELSAAERMALIRLLVPVAAANPTALDTVLARLLLAERPTDTAILGRLAVLAPMPAVRQQNNLIGELRLVPP